MDQEVNGVLEKESTRMVLVELDFIDLKKKQIYIFAIYNNISV